MSQPANLAAELDSWAERSANQLAVAWGRKTWSYRNLAHHSRRAAGALNAVGVERGTRVGLLQPNRPRWLACAFGAWRLGAIVVPINTLYQRSELRHALGHAEVEVLVATREFLRHDYMGRLQELCPRLFGNSGEDELPVLRRVLFSDAPDLPAERCWDTLIDAGAESSEISAPAAHGDAAIFFTSGSTAAAKGVVHTHAGMLRAAANVAERLGLTASDRAYGYLPMFFNGGFVGVALSALHSGGAVLLQDVFDPAAAVDLMERHHCTVFFGWPHQAEAIAREPGFDRERIHLHKGPGANAPWAEALLAEDHHCVGTWGMSETGPMAACSHHRDSLDERRSSHGRPMPGLELRIVDDSNCPVATGTAGEITVRGSSLMRTYYGSTPKDCFDEDGYFHTGDQGRLDEAGRLHFIGRLRDVIKTAGANVAAAEVEQILLTHPDVESAYVVPIPHATRGENVAAFIVTRRESSDLATVLQHCRDNLASYKVPRHLFRIAADDVPTLGSGKVDRAALRERAARAADAT